MAFLNFIAFFCVPTKNNYCSKTICLGSFYMPHGIGADASVVLVVFLFNSDSFPIILAKLKKNASWIDRRTDKKTDRQMNGRTDGQMDGRTDKWMDGHTFL